MSMRTRVIRTGKTGSTHTVNRPLRVPGERVVVEGTPFGLSDRVGRSGQVLPREKVLDAAPFEIDVRLFDPPEPAPLEEFEEIEESDEPTQEELEAARLAEAVDAARQEGFAAGYENARAELETEFRTKAEALLADAQRMHEENTRFLERAEVLLVDLAFRIAETVLDSPLLAPARDAAKDALANAIERLAGGVPVRVRVHPVDYLRLQEAGLVDQFSAVYGDLRWEPDSSYAQGEWSVESPDSVIRRLERELLSDLRERLGLLTLPPPDEKPEST